MNEGPSNSAAMNASRLVRLPFVSRVQYTLTDQSGPRWSVSDRSAPAYAVTDQSAPHFTIEVF